MANRDDPVDGRVSQLSLLKEGKLILTNSVGITVWTTRTAALTTSDASNLQLQLLNTGNLVLHNSTGFVIWQSFDSPTDTLLPQQTLTMVSSLISKRSQGDYSSGNYLLSFNDDNVLRLLFQGPKISSVYWPDPSLADPGLAGRSKYGTRTRAVLNDSGYFESTDYFTFITTDYGVVTHRRLTLDPDGNLRLYSLQEMNGVWDWFVTWQAFSDPCKIHGTYGLNEFIVSCNNINESSFIQLAHVEYYGSDIDFYQNHTLQLCQDECLKSLIGTSLSVDKPSDNLVSENGEYSAGFFLVGDNAFCFAIWFNKSSNSTVVWMANRDDPVDGKGSKLSLLKDGKLILSNSVAALTSSDDTNLQLQFLNTGNLVLHNSTGFVIWQSFDSPVDTLLPLQTLTMVSSLISKRSQADYSSGYYKLSFNDDNVLRLLFQGPTISSVYWPDPSLANPGLAGRSKYGTRRRAVPRLWRLTLDTDGNLRLYSLQEMNEVWEWFVTWQAFSDPCRIHGICGLNGVCSYDHVFGRKCSCLQGFKMKDQTDWSYGCEPEFSVSCNNTDKSSFVQLAHVEYYVFGSLIRKL
uniref:Bulb-type lectin domain-containing protein n=1 Tax=Fagus sylvatica TaxID=28930 RepID=A0A2N9GKG8_FAGSY